MDRAAPADQQVQAVALLGPVAVIRLPEVRADPEAQVVRVDRVVADLDLR